MTSNYELAAGLIEAECRTKLSPLTKAEDILAVTFKAARNHWMFTDEQDQFRGALGAALIHLKAGSEYVRLEKSVTALGKLSALLNALQQGLSVDMEAMLEEQQREKEAGFELIPLQRMWQDARAPSNGS